LGKNINKLAFYPISNISVDGSKYLLIITLQHNGSVAVNETANTLLDDSHYTPST
jgi:hypothetical protein